MLGKSPEHVRTVRPIQKGVICDFEATNLLIKALFDKYSIKTRFRRRIGPTMILSIPSNITEVEVTSLIDSIKEAGVLSIYVVESSISNLIGAGSSLDEIQASLVVDVGAGKLDIALISSGQVVMAERSNLAGEYMDRAIVRYVRQKYNLDIGKSLAERIKVKSSSIVYKKDVESYEISGRDLVSGLPKTISISGYEISEPLIEVFKKISSTIKDFLEKVPSDLISDIVDSGIVLTGGSSQIRGGARILEKDLKVKVNQVDEPLLNNIYGLDLLIGDFRAIERFKVKDLILK